MAVALPGWSYAAVAGAALLNSMMRARVIASREAGVSETREALLEAGVYEGLELAGSRLGAVMVGDLPDARPDDSLMPIAQADLGGAGLWLRAEPAHDEAQADAIARIVAEGLRR